LALKYGRILLAYLAIFINDDYAAYAGDTITVLFGLLATQGVYEYSSKRLVTLTFLSAIGFALGSYIGTAVTRVVATNLLIEAQLQYAVLGFVGGAIFELHSRNLKKILIRGGLCAAAGIIGCLSVLLFPSLNLILRNIIYGIWFGIAFGLSTRRISDIAFLAILGSAIFTITAIYVANLNSPIMIESIVRGSLIGLVLGFGYAYITRGTETTD
jgi:hypothetical protein